jgi:hypothetical protein
VTIALTSGSAAPRKDVATTFNVTAAPAAGTSPPSAITSMSIDFGDGESVSLPGSATTVAHVFRRSGTFTVTARATDSAGATGSGSTVIVVTD